VRASVAIQVQTVPGNAAPQGFRRFGSGQIVFERTGGNHYFTIFPSSLVDALYDASGNLTFTELSFFSNLGKRR
jgi:hypothetical protein